MMAKQLHFTNKEVAHLLRSISAALEIKKADRFRIMAYDRASTAVEHATAEVKDLWDEGKLQELPGIGTSITSYMDELFSKGEVKHFEEILKGLPPAMFEFIKIPGIGAKTAYKLCQNLKIFKKERALEKLKQAAREGKIKGFEGFGEQSEKDILVGLGELDRKTKRLLLPFAGNLAKDILNYLKSNCPSAIRADPLGSLRRGCATVGDIDIAVASRNPKEVVDCFVKYPKASRIVEKGEAKARILVAGIHQIDLMVQDPASYGALLQHFTGSKPHNIALREIALKKGWSLSEYGIKKVKSPAKFSRCSTRPIRPCSAREIKAGKQKSKVKSSIIKFKDEEGFYKALGMEWIPPELRENAGEIEAAQRHELPKLVTLKEIKGDLHIHSPFDLETSHDLGRSSFEELIQKAQNLGHEYIAFADHNPSTGRHNDKQIIEILKRRKEKIEQIKYSRELEREKRGKKLSIFCSLEVDIKPNGKRAIPDEAFDYLDFAIISVHSSFRMDREKMTKRILTAFDHPKVKILGHPTGRKLGERESYELDWDKVFDFCKRNERFLEINAFPDRLDLPDILVREAVKNKVGLVINTDAHEVDHLDLMEYGVFVARRGWAEKSDIINTLSNCQIAKLLNCGEGR